MLKGKEGYLFHHRLARQVEPVIERFRPQMLLGIAAKRLEAKMAEWAENTPGDHRIVPLNGYQEFRFEGKITSGNYQDCNVTLHSTKKYVPGNPQKIEALTLHGTIDNLRNPTDMTETEIEQLTQIFFEVAVHGQKTELEFFWFDSQAKQIGGDDWDVGDINWRENGELFIETRAERVRLGEEITLGLLKQLLSSSIQFRTEVQ